MVNPSAIVASAITPAVMISAGALMLLSFSNRATAVMVRQRVLNRELLHDNVESDRWTDGLQRQVAAIGFETCLIRSAVILLFVSILCMISCGLSLSLKDTTIAAGYSAVAFFVAGMLSFGFGVCVMLVDAFIMTRPVQLESRLASQLTRDRRSRGHLGSAGEWRRPGEGDGGHGLGPARGIA